MFFFLIIRIRDKTIRTLNCHCVFDHSIWAWQCKFIDQSMYKIIYKSPCKLWNIHHDTTNSIAAVHVLFRFAPYISLSIESTEKLSCASWFFFVAFHLWLEGLHLISRNLESDSAEYKYII